MSDSEAKTRPASRRKLQKKREEGALPQAGDLSAMLAAAVAILMMLLTFPIGLRLVTRLFDEAAAAALLPFDQGAALGLAATLRALFLLIVPVAGVALAISILVTVVYNKGLIFAIKPIVPNLERISPGSGFKRVYGKRGWIETGQALVRLTLWAGGAAATIWSARSTIFTYRDCGVGCLVDLALSLVVPMIGLAALLLVVSGGVDMLVQRFLFMDEQKMSESEVKRENKEQAGAPEIRQERRRQRQEAAGGVASVGVHRANMCFYHGNRAVGLRYHPEHAPLPRIAALARTAGPATALRARIRDNGFPEMDSASIVAACCHGAPGEGVPEEIFADLAFAMKTMFAQGV